MNKPHTMSLQTMSIVSGDLQIFQPYTRSYLSDSVDA